MSKTAKVDFENPKYQKWIENFKSVFKVKMDKDIAEILGVQPAGYSHFKRNDKFPYERVVDALLKKGVLIDTVFNANLSSESIKKVSAENAIEIINMKNEVIQLPMITQNQEKSLKAYIQDGSIYIVDIQKNEYSHGSNYLLQKNNIYYLRNIDMSMDGGFYIAPYNKIVTNEIDKIKLNNEDFRGFTILGEIVSQYFISKG